MKIALFCFVSILCFVGCTADGASTDALHKAGFYDVETTGYEMFACGEDDTFKTGFRAKNALGVTVEGTVCCGVFKDCTIRF